MSDNSTHANYNLGRAIYQSLLQLPSPRKLVNNFSKEYPYVFVGDEAFSVRCNFLKPFSLNVLELAYLIFNCKFSRARRIVENVFGVATSRLRVFSRSICAKVETAIDITKAVIIIA